jgi:hypothetical protein
MVLPSLRSWIARPISAARSTRLGPPGLVVDGGGLLSGLAFLRGRKWACALLTPVRRSAGRSTVEPARLTLHDLRVAECVGQERRSLHSGEQRDRQVARVPVRKRSGAVSVHGRVELEEHVRTLTAAADDPDALEADHELADPAPAHLHASGETTVPERAGRDPQRPMAATGDPQVDPEAPNRRPSPSTRCHLTRTVSPGAASSRTGLSSLARTPSFATEGTASRAATAIATTTSTARRIRVLYACRAPLVPGLVSSSRAIRCGDARGGRGGRARPGGRRSSDRDRRGADGRRYPG